MSTKKTNEHGVDLDKLYEMIDGLQAKNAALEMDNQDLLESLERMERAVVQMEDRYNDERKQRVEIQREKVSLEDKARYLSDRLSEAQGQRVAERNTRHGSIPKFVVVAAVALVVLLASFMLQKLSAIGPAVGYTIQCAMSMVIAWCYAIIWDRSRK